MITTAPYTHCMCWICGRPADSSEHMVKASDVRQVFGHITQYSPIFRHSSDQPNLAVPGIRSENLRFSRSICAHCNNSRTQSHDKAWEIMSRGIRELDPPLYPGAIIPIDCFFPGNAEAQVRNIHLFFTKLFGCTAVEHGAPLPVTEFAQSIVKGEPHPNIRLIFVHIPPGSSRYAIHVGPIQLENKSGRTAAHWYYSVGTVGVFLSYAERLEERMTRDVGWHPDDGALIRMA